jgi:hypothetical protein
MYSRCSELVDKDRSLIDFVKAFLILAISPPQAYLEIFQSSHRFWVVDNDVKQFVRPDLSSVTIVTTHLISKKHLQRWKSKRENNGFIAPELPSRPILSAAFSFRRLTIKHSRQPVGHAFPDTLASPCQPPSLPSFCSFLLGYTLNLVKCDTAQCCGVTR